jgi:hypothetical protein
VRDPDDLVVLTRVPDELSALLLVGDLASQGIPATVIGGLTAQLRAEAPGLVSVLVRRRDAERAEALLAENEPPGFSDGGSEADWEDAAEAAAREGEPDDEGLSDGDHDDGGADGRAPRLGGDL